MNRFHILFYFKKPKKYNKSALPIYMRISTACDRTELSTQRKWEPSRWNQDARRALGTKEDARSLNAHLDTLPGKVYEAQRQLIADNQDVTIKNIRLRMEEKRADARMLIEIFKEHNERVAQRIDKDFSPGTLERYETVLSHTVSFLQWKYKVSDIDIQDLNHEFVTVLEFWLKSVRAVAIIQQ